MMTPEKLKGFVNSSGFPLQIAIEHLVRSKTLSHGWKVRYKEHSWNNRQTANAGFIDLVLADERGSSAMVVECKRVQDTSWIFLLPSMKKAKRKPAHVWASRLDGQEEPRFFDWNDITMEPSSAECEFCIVPGQDQKSRPMLERIASELIEATEALAWEDYYLNSEQDIIRMYANVIVTTAELHLCAFSPGDVSIDTGMIDKADFMPVPSLRFRKSLSTKSVSELNLKEKSDASLVRAKENTVFIVNSGHFEEFLNSFGIDDGFFRQFG